MGDGVSRHTLRVRDADLAPGEYLDDYVWELIDPLAGVASLRVTGTARSLMPGRFAGAGVTFDDPDGLLFSGDLVDVSADSSQAMSLIYHGDTARAWGALAYPSPTADWEHQSVVDTDVRTGPAESVALAYLAANLGPAAHASHRVTGLVVPASAGRGPTVTRTARFDLLGPLVTDLLLLAGLRWRVRQVGDHLEVQVLTCPDLSDSAKWGTSADGAGGEVLPGWSYRITRPTHTRAMVAGGGEGTARLMREVITTASLAAEAAWGRRLPTFIDQRQTTIPAELVTAGEEALAGVAATVRVNATLTDYDDVQLGSTVPVGSWVSIDLAGQVSMRAQITQITITGNTDGIRRTAVIGPPEGDITLDEQQTAALTRTLRRLSAT